MTYLYIGIAGAIGAILRYLVSLVTFVESGFPFATLIVNLIGSFLLPLISYRWLKKLSVAESIKIAITTGLIGSFTTFSTFSIETVYLIDIGQVGLAFVYIFLSMLGGLTCSAIAFRLSEGRRAA